MEMHKGAGGAGKNKIVKAWIFLREYGFKEFVIKVKNKLLKSTRYHRWFMAHRVTSEQLEEQKNTVFEYSPKISILVPTYRTPIPMLREMIDSVRNQSYQNWELCIADGSVGARISATGEQAQTSENAPEKSPLEDELKRYHELDERIVYRILTTNGGISRNTNAALEFAGGEYIGLLDHDDVLEPDALFEVVKALQGKADIVYTDEDKATNNLKKFMDPNFKPDYSPDLFLSHNYITHFFVVKAEIMRGVGGFRPEFDGSQDYDLMFRCIEKSDKIEHVAKVLYHWRLAKGSTAENPENKMYCYEAGRKAIEEHLSRVGIKGKTEMTSMWGMYHTVFETEGNPLVSVIIPNKDHAADLDLSIRSIIEKSTYKNLEFIVAENNSTEKDTFEYYEKIQKEFSNVKVVTWDKPFNYSAINNFAVENSKGEYLLLLNNDTEMISETAIEEMLGICQRSDVGAVGAKLLYPDDTVQHAGIFLGMHGYACHVFSGIGRYDYGFMVRARINCNYNAVTAACLMTKRSVYDAVGGFSEDLPVAGNDVDFCLKIRDKNLVIVYNAFSEWYHYESKSRGYEDTPEKVERFKKEVERFRLRWGERVDGGDEYYNSNFNVNHAPYEL